MSHRWMPDDDDETVLDAELVQALRVVDPVTDDPNYWFRFRAWVVESAGPELARRRIVADITVGDVLSAWARTLVPTALLAAAVAGVLLLRQPLTPSPSPLSIEEVLVAGLGVEEPIPADETGSAVAFASDRF